MKLNKLEILSALDALNVPFELRGALLSLAVGRVIAYGIALPPVAIDGDDVLTAGVRTEIERLVYDLNESVAIDTDAAIAVACKVYLFRYRLVHSPFNIAVTEFLDALLRTGASSISPAQADLMTNYGDDKSLLNTLTRSIWNQAIVADAEETQVAPAVESAACVCPSMECHVHPGQGSA